VRVIRGQVEQDFGLKRVGVLKLVDEQARVALLHAPAHRGMVAQKLARKEEQVRMLQHAAVLALLSVARYRRPEELRGALMHERIPAAQHGADGVLNHVRKLFVAQVVDALVGVRPALAPGREGELGLIVFDQPLEAFQEGRLPRWRRDLFVREQLLGAVEGFHHVVAVFQRRIGTARLPSFE